MTTRIAVLNNTIYRISEAKYQKITAMMIDEHQTSCDLIKRWGKKILTADIMLRDD